MKFIFNLILLLAVWPVLLPSPSVAGLGEARARLEECGVALELAYTSEGWGNLRGGMDQGGAYRGNVDLVLTLDLERLGLWRGGRFVVYGQNGHGQGITERHVGDLQGVSEIEADSFTQLSEYWLDQRLLGDRIRLKLGKQDASDVFGASDFAAPFIHSSFGLIPTVPMPSFPDPGLGAAVFARTARSAPWLSLGLGVYEGDPDGGRLGWGGLVDGEGGVFSIAELELRGAVGPGRSLESAVRAGLWHHSGRFDEPGPDPGTRPESYGFYVLLDQWLYREPADGGGQGLGVFGQFGRAPRDRSEITRYWGGGLAYTGLLPGRGADVVGIGAARARLSSKLPDPVGGRAETAIELFYRARISSWLWLQPDFQVVLRPGGAGRDAIVLGLRFELRL